MSIGSETDGGVSAIDVQDLTIDGADNGLRIKSNSSRGGLVHQGSYSNVCIRGVKNPIVIDPFYSTERGQKPPDFRDIRLQNVFVATPGKITLLGLDAEHPLGVTLDGVQVNGIRTEDIRAAHSRLTLGPGNVNFKPAGGDVGVSNVQGEHRGGLCGADFVPFPTGAEPAPRRSERCVAKLSLGARMQAPLVVAADGSGDYRSVQEAIDELPQDGGVIGIRPGVYREVVTVDKAHVRLDRKFINDLVAGGTMVPVLWGLYINQGDCRRCNAILFFRRPGRRSLGPGRGDPVEDQITCLSGTRFRYHQVRRRG
jgi:polygalacturonase